MALGMLKTVWPSGLRRWLKAPFRKGVGSDPTGVNSVLHSSWPTAQVLTDKGVQICIGSPWSQSNHHRRIVIPPGTDRYNLHFLWLIWPGGPGPCLTMPRRTGAGSIPAGVLDSGAHHPLGKRHRLSLPVTQAMFMDALAERSKAVAQGVIP